MSLVCTPFCVLGGSRERLRFLEGDGPPTGRRTEDGQNGENGCRWSHGVECISGPRNARDVIGFPGVVLQVSVGDDLLRW